VTPARRTIVRSGGIAPNCHIFIVCVAGGTHFYSL